jgi:hypothetical protein
VAKKLLLLQALLLQVKEEPAGAAAEHAREVDGTGDVALHGNVIEFVRLELVEIDLTVTGIKAKTDDDLRTSGDVKISQYLCHTIIMMGVPE